MERLTLRAWLLRIAIGALLPAGIVASTMLFFWLTPWDVSDMEGFGLMLIGGIGLVFTLPWGLMVGIALVPQAAEALVVRTGDTISPVLITAILNSFAGLVVGAVIWWGATALAVWVPRLWPSPASGAIRL